MEVLSLRSKEFIKDKEDDKEEVTETEMEEVDMKKLKQDVEKESKRK